MALVFFQCLINALFARTALSVSGVGGGGGGGDKAPQHLYMIMSFSYVGAMLASNDALRFISYPTQVLGKSVKPIPVMILGVVMARKRYPLKKYLYVLMIVLGVVLFMYNPKKALSSQTTQSFYIGRGEFLLLLSLLLDGITGGTQDRIRGQHRTQAHQMMLLMNLWSSLYLLVGLIATGELFTFVGFCQKFPWVLVQLIMLSICSAIGQNFIFMTITNFGPLPCSIITTTRKFFTILGSVFIFGHTMSSLQWAGTLLVFAGIALDTVYGKEAKVSNKA